MQRAVITSLCLLAVATPLVVWPMVRKSSPTVDATHVLLHGRTPIGTFLALVDDAPGRHSAQLQSIRENWTEGEEPMLIETARFTRSRDTRRAIVETLAQVTGQDFGAEFDRWYRWVWKREASPHPNYADFKKALYSRIDPRFADYFADNRESVIRLDEVRWGGVRRDGIPRLKNPDTISAANASYLADADVVFGVRFGGRARAYPKRILAWHEMVKDVVGGESINGVYCTLCGSMIVYRTEVDGKHYELGTSGFLYRSNKLMYDRGTKSMWSTLRGEPVIGPLVGRGIELEPLYVVTTTWGEWKKRHPDTDVLSLRTGHRRDYGEGAAYRDYFATDELMFTVPETDSRLKNKDEVLVLRGDSPEPVAIAVSFLRNNPVHYETFGDQRVVILTDGSSASRVYEAGGVRLVGWLDDWTLVSADGGRWKVGEHSLAREADSSTLKRVAAHRAFWFGWYASFPNTRLVK